LTRKHFYDTLTGFSVLKHGWASSWTSPFERKCTTTRVIHTCG